MSGPAVAYATVPDPVRPAVLAYPSPTSVRFVILVVATLFAGLFAGDWVHNIVAGDRWQQTVAACHDGAPAALADPFARQAAFQTCTAEAERGRALYSLAGLVISAIAAAVALYASPAVLERRRRLRPAGPKLAAATARVAELATTAGLRRAPALMVGPVAQRDAFCYGVPARYRMVLPTKLAVKPGTKLFDALVAHELAHVARRDVTVAWLARSVGFALLPVLVTPVLLAAATGDLSAVGDYSWRALLLGAVILVVRAAILRSREFDADLRAARHGSDVATLADVVGSLPHHDSGRRRRLLANHPSPAARVAVLRNPATATRVGLLDGLVAAFLAALTLPLVDLTVVPLLTAAGPANLTDVVTALIAGPLLGGAVGLTLWRASLVRRLTGAPVRLLPITAGVFAGYLAGATVSLGRSGAGPPDLSLVIGGLCLAGATVTTAGLGELWADAAGRLRSARASWWAAVLLPGVLFAVALWAGRTTQKAAGWGGWELVRLILPEYFDRVPLLVAAAVLAGAAGWALWASRRAALTPAWLLEAGPRYDWPQARPPRLGPAVIAGVTAGAAGALVMVVFRVVVGAAATDAEALQRFSLYVLIAAGAAAAAGFGPAVADPGRGAGTALLSVPIAGLAGSAGFLALNTALGGHLTPVFVTEVVRKPVGLALVAELVLVSMLLPALTDRRRPVPAAPVAALAAALVAATTVVAARDTLIPVTPVPAVEATRTPAGEPQAYRDQVFPAISGQIQLITAGAGTIDTDPTLDPAGRAFAVRNQVVLPLRQLRTEAGGVSVTAPEVRQAHAVCLRGLDDAISAYEFLATAYETGDPRAANEAFVRQNRAVSSLRQWSALVGTF